MSKVDLITFTEALVVITINRTVVNEDVRSAIISEETIALGVEACLTSELVVPP